MAGLPEEWRRQIAVNKWLRLALPPEAYYTAIDHAAKMSMQMGAIRKARGVKPGIPDWYIFYRGITVWAEEKSSDGTASDFQIKTGKYLRDNGATWGVFVTLEELEALLRSAGIPVRAHVQAPVSAAPATPKPKKKSRPRPPPADRAKLRAFARLRDPNGGILF